MSKMRHLKGFNESKIYGKEILPKEAIEKLKLYVNVDNDNNKIEVYPDPKVDGSYALRIHRYSGGNARPYVFTLLWNHGDFDEVDFDEFPPKSGNLKFW